MFDKDLDQLVQQTMDMSENTTTRRDPFDAFKKAMNSEIQHEMEYKMKAQASELSQNDNQAELPNFDDEEVINPIPEAPGVLFSLSAGLGTVLIRTTPSKNLAADYEKFAANQSDENQLYFFETDYFELSEIITDQFNGKRFPIEEDRVCNISDPSYNWWAEVSDNSLKISFRSFGLVSEGNTYRLGPISDALVASVRLGQSKELFKSMFPVSQFSLSERQFYIETLADGHPNFDILKNLFVKGRGANKIYYSVNGKIDRTLYYYFKELEAVRRFWLCVEENLGL